MKWIFNFLIFLLCLQRLEASTSQIYLGSRESDPASLVENVSTIHGDYTEVEVDLIVPSPDSLTLSRFYSSQDTIHTATFGGWRFHPQCFLSLQKDPNGTNYTTAEGKFERAYVRVGNPDGTILTYVGWQNTTTPSKRSLFKIDPEGETVGICNTAKGTISSWSNLKNNELYFDPQTDSFELLLCSEGKRFYAKHPSLGIYFITQEILPSGNKLFYEFDEKGQLSLIKETNASEKKVLAWIQLHYGNGIHVETSDGKTVDYQFQQDSSGAYLLTAVERSNKPTVQYQYQVVDNHPLLIRKTLPEGRFVQVDYDTDKGNPHKVRSVTVPEGSRGEASIHFSYGDGRTEINIASRDPMGNILEEILPGHGGGRKQSWDSSGRRIEISTDFFQDKVLEGGCDPLDHIQKRETTLDDETSTTEYEYNPLSQLILERGEIEHRYFYDSLGNRLQRDDSVYQIDGLNQLVEAEGASYAFDAHGNLATKTLGQKLWVYQWNPLNQLISIQDPDQNIVSFTYDVTGKRLTKKIEPKGKTARIFRFFYLGNTEIGSLDEKGVIVELKIPSNPNHPEFFPCIAIEVKKATYVPLYDLQGNIACLLDPQRRTIVESYRYTAFGEEEITNAKGRVVSDSSVDNPWRYRGKRVDKEVGLMCFGQRYYDSEIGRWISPDPAGDIDGPNLYAFVGNNPMTYVDYFGLASEKNENQTKEFNGYFYGEYEPHCHCEAHRNCKRGGDIGGALGSGGITFSGVGHQVANFILTDPRFHGTLQALGGLAEASFGGGVTLATCGSAAPFGWPVMAHGLDQFITGMSTACTGRPRDTLTSQLLQKAGMSHHTANFVDSSLNIGGTMGAAAAIRVSRFSVFPKFCLTTQGPQTTLYRAVQPAELADIQKTAIFRNLGNAEGKYFTTSVEGASVYAKKAVTGFCDPPYTLVKTQVPNNILNGTPPTLVDGGIPTWVIHDQTLEKLIPEIMNWMAVPK